MGLNFLERSCVIENSSKSRNELISKSIKLLSKEQTLVVLTSHSASVVKFKELNLSLGEKVLSDGIILSYAFGDLRSVQYPVFDSFQNYSNKHTNIINDRTDRGFVQTLDYLAVFILQTIIYYAHDFVTLYLCIT